MQDQAEERRQQDRRDLEFFRSRVRPTCSDLWRVVDKRKTFNSLPSGRGADEMIWPLIASGAVLILLAWTGMLGRVASIIP